jgi:hypothetical protein
MKLLNLYPQNFSFSIKLLAALVLEKDSPSLYIKAEIPVELPVYFGIDTKAIVVRPPRNGFRPSAPASSFKQLHSSSHSQKEQIAED